MDIIKWIKEKAKQTSTWKGLVFAGGVIALANNPEWQEQVNSAIKMIVEGGGILYSLIAVFWSKN